MQYPGEGFRAYHGIIIKYNMELPSTISHKDLLLLHRLVANVGWGGWRFFVCRSRVASDVSFSANEICCNTSCNSRHVVIHFTKDIPFHVASGAQNESIFIPRVTLNFHHIRRWD
jgi:hypothetical protein